MLLPLLQNNLLEVAGASASVSASLTESGIVAGGGEITLTLSNDTWVAAGATFDAQRQAILDGFTGATLDLSSQSVTTVVRTSDTVVTITLEAVPGYSISADETVSVTVPGSALTGASDLDAGSFTVTADTAATLFGSLTEHTVRTGGESLYITLVGDTWVSGQAFNDARQAIIDGLVSAQSEKRGWNAKVRDRLKAPAVRRLSEAVIVIDLLGFPAYETSANETITATVPASALTGGVALTATPTLTVVTDGQAGIVNADASTEPSNYEICDRTGFRVRPNELETEWSGRMVRPASFEEQHPQDFVKSRSPETPRGPKRPEGEDRFIGEGVDEVSASDL